MLKKTRPAPEKQDQKKRAVKRHRGGKHTENYLGPKSNRWSQFLKTRNHEKLTKKNSEKTLKGGAPKKWYRIERTKGVKAALITHVPPTTGNRRKTHTQTPRSCSPLRRAPQKVNDKNKKRRRKRCALRGSKRGWKKRDLMIRSRVAELVGSRWPSGRS